MVGRLTNMMYSENSIKKIEDALDNLIQEDNYFLEDCYHHENHFEKRFHFETGAVVSYVGYYLYSEQKKISCDNWLNESIKKIVDEFPSVGFPIDDISITSVLLNFLDSSKNVNCVHICSDGCIYVKTETNENKGGKGISIEDFIHEYLVFDSIEEKEQKKQKIQSVFDYHISILKHIETQDISSINPKSSLYREILKKRKINKYFSFFPFYYYGSCYKRVFFVLTILQSDYLYPEFDDEGECIVESYPPIIESDKVLKIQLYLQSALWQLLQDRLSYEKRKSVSESLKSAKAAIMSRNMSHNLGSHVMFYIKQKLQSVSKIVDNKVLDNIIPGNIATIADIEEKIKANKDIELPFLVGLGRFINYIQERQDYIATIATDYIPANSTISFKDFVYDELKPDLRYERHYSQNNDAGWQPGNLLLDYIAYSERYRSCNDIKILFGEFDGHNPQKEGSPSDVDFKKLREFNIAVPGGVVGRQAIFSIFENIIRNAAKHSGRRNDNKLVLQLSLLGKDDNLFNNDDFKSIRNDDMAKYDVSGNILKAKYEECFDKYHVLRIKIDMPNDAKTVNKLVEKLADPYLEENGNMKESSKGLKEMRISAAWLRGYSIDTEIPANEPPALSIYTEPYVEDNSKETISYIDNVNISNNKKVEDNSKVTISYVVCLPKPCRVAFVVECDNRDVLNDLLTPYGCKVFTDPFKLKDEEDRDKLINEIANYEIVCMPTNLKTQLCPYISSRYIINEDQTETLLKNLTDSIEKTNYKDEEAKKEAIENSIGSIYETWFGTTYNDDILKLVVADEKAVENKKTEKETGSLSSDNNVILTATTSITAKEVSGAVVYSTHFKGLFAKNDKDSEPEGYNGMLANAISIESVTGNNSTARLIRQDKWNKEWKIKLISSGIARVAIFDERIFNSFISCESTAHKDSLNIETILELKNENLNDFKKILWDNYRIPNNVSGKIFFEKNQEKINKALEKYLTLYHYTHNVAQKNHERGIWAFDIRIAGEVNERVEIVGYNVHIGNRVGLYNEHKTDAIITIAKISRHSEIAQYDVELCDDKKVFEDGKSNVFDYISIHQGVLDKIYTAFGIKDQEVEKYKVTNALHRCFSKQETPTDVKELLPNFIIHSGRSKPSKNDMPQSQPFVQFAAVDHAVKDCKYTLVELLATAHYEKGNNNN